MSHFSRIKTKFVEKEQLILALKDLGFSPQQGDVKVKSVEDEEERVDFMVPTAHTGYGIGFKKAGAGGEYEVIADWAGIVNVERGRFIKNLKQRYAYHTVIRSLGEKGFECVEEKDEEEATIRLTLRRVLH